MTQRIGKIGTITINDLSGGLNTVDGAGGLLDNQYAEGVNIYLIGKMPAKRKGFTRWNNSVRVNSSNQGLGIYHAKFIAGSKIIAVAGSSIKVKGTNSWTDITGSVTLTSGKPVMFTMINNVLVGTNGVNPAWYYDGTGVAVALSGENIPTAPTCCASFHGRLILAQGRTMYWSEYMGDWKTFDADGVQDFGSTIIGFGVTGDELQSSAQSRLIILTDEPGVHTCVFDISLGEDTSGQAIFLFDTITMDHGCIASKSVCGAVNNKGVVTIIWADADGLKLLDGNKVIKLTDNIQPDWDSLNLGQLSDAIGIFYKPKYWYMLFCCDTVSRTHNKVIVYDLRSMCVVGYFDLAVSAIGIVTENGIDKLIGSDYSGYWNTYDTGYDDNGSAIVAYFKTKALGSGQYIDPFENKNPFSLLLQYAYVGEYDFGVNIYYEHIKNIFSATAKAKTQGVLDSFTLDQDLLDVSARMESQAIELRGWGRFFQVEIRNEVIGETFIIHRMDLSYRRGINIYR